MTKGKNEGLHPVFETQGPYLVTRDVREVMWHYRREQNGVVDTLTKGELKPLFFTFVISTYATSSCTHVHESGVSTYIITKTY